MQATAKIVFQTAPKKRNKDGLYPVRLRITYKEDRMYYSIAEKLKNNEWAFLSKEDVDAFESRRNQGNIPLGKLKDVYYE